MIHDGVAPLPGAIDCLRALLAAGKRVALLSNAPRRADDVIRRITAIGVPAGLYHHVMSSGEEAWQYLKRREDPFYRALGFEQTLRIAGYYRGRETAIRMMRLLRTPGLAPLAWRPPTLDKQ